MQVWFQDYRAKWSDCELLHTFRSIVLRRRHPELVQLEATTI